MEERYLDLLIVSVDEKLYIVEMGSHEANVHDLVEFENEWGSLIRGEVVDKMWCQSNDDPYRCISHVHTIHPAKRVYRLTWEASKIPSV